MKRRTIWRWGVVLPVSLVAVAGVAADIVTSTVAYWWLLAPSYPVIAIETWRGMGERDDNRRRRGRWARPEEEGALPDAFDSPSMMDRPSPANVSVGSAVGGAGKWVIRLLATLGMTFVYMVLIWAVIAVGTWGKAFWYVYVPALALLAGAAWFIWRESVRARAEQLAAKPRTRKPRKPKSAAPSPPATPQSPRARRPRLP